MKRFIKLAEVLLKYTADLTVILLSSVAALMVRFDFDLARAGLYYDDFLRGLPWLAAGYLLMMIIVREHRILWRFAGTREMVEFCIGAALSSVPYMIALNILTENYPAGLYFITAVFMSAALMVLRTAYKVFYKLLKRRNSEGGKIVKSYRKIMIIGAGSAGSMLLYDIENNRQMRGYRVACFIDDDEAKKGRRIGRVPVAGDCGSIALNAKKYGISEIIFAIPSCETGRRAEILRLCSETGCVVKALPRVGQLFNGQVGVGNLRNVQVEDLLGRDPVKLNLERVRDFIAGKKVMVTGGGGSIGSELCRQIASYRPAELIIFDIYENNLYDIQNELLRDYPDLNLAALVGSVRDIARVETVLECRRPDVIYHAAAHKHVPLMEESPREAIKNNVFGTYNMVRAADKYGVGRFIMISTDKAVNPTNVMGATKRICEMIIQSYAKRSATDFVAVRFGNVLGSNGSVIPLFKKQIEAGGPVTVTHPDIIRYFMTIPEAVSLVLEAGIEASGGEIFVLDMGEPVRILSLAENLIRLSGYAPYKDIMIKFTGLRPGEKLYEETLMAEEGLKATSNRLIHIGRPIEFDEKVFFGHLEELRKMSEDDRADLRVLLRELVPTYTMPDRVCGMTASSNGATPAGMGEVGTGAGDYDPDKSGDTGNDTAAAGNPGAGADDGNLSAAAGAVSGSA